MASILCCMIVHTNHNFGFRIRGLLATVMRQKAFFKSVLLTTLSLAILCSSAQMSVAAPKKIKARSSFGFIGGIGQPAGWWGDRWDMPIVSEINFHYEFARGAGLLLFAGISTAQFTDLSDEEIVSESNLGDIPPEFKPYTTLTHVSQSGTYKENPLGIGFYYERMITPRRLRGYGTAALVVHIWKVTRGQRLERESQVSDMPEIPNVDNWSTTDNGSDLGAQAALGISYQMRRFMFFDASLAYNFSNIGKHNGAVLYWGLPGRTKSGGVYDRSEGSTDLIQLRLGLRFGT